MNKTEKKEEKDVKEEGKETKQADKHHSILIDLVCKELSITPDDIMDLELQLFDMQPACVGGKYIKHLIQCFLFIFLLFFFFLFFLYLFIIFM